MNQILVSLFFCYFQIIPVNLLGAICRTNFNTIPWDFKKIMVVSVLVQKKTTKRLVSKSNKSFAQKLNLISFSVLLW